jgi:predicted transglutaminase-like cysteine proteinase
MSAAAATAGNTYLLASVDMPPPNGAQNICEKYNWACAGQGKAVRSVAQEMALVEQVNTMVNSSVKPASDRRQFRSRDYWSLPTASGGDCEDFALLKKRELVRLGVDHRKLLLATVLDRKRVPHAVLVYRSDRGDLLLDNLTNDIRDWRSSRYIFLRMQNPQNPRSWVGGFQQG